MKKAIKADLETTWKFTPVGKGPASDQMFLFSSETPKDAIGDELCSEYFVGSEHFAEVLQIIFNLDKEVKELINNVEIRPMVGDDFDLSPAYKKYVFGINISWLLDESIVNPLMSAFEQKIKHLIHGICFSKNFIYGYKDLEMIYGNRIQKFRELRDQYDFQRKLRNLYYLEKFGEHREDL